MISCNICLKSRVARSLKREAVKGFIPLKYSTQYYIVCVITKVFPKMRTDIRKNSNF